MRHDSGIPLSVRIRVQPFEFTMGAYAALSGFFGLLNIGTIFWGVDALFSDPLAFTLDLFYMLAGLLIVGGVITGLLKVEAGGLSVLVSGALIRLMVTVVLSWEFGQSAEHVHLMLFYVFLIIACMGRWHAIMSDDITIVMRGRVES